VKGSGVIAPGLRNRDERLAMTDGVNGLGGSGPAIPLRSKTTNAASRPGRSDFTPEASNGRRTPAVTSEMRGIVRDISAKPPVDASKVERLAGAISAGSYKVDAAKLADAMIASEMPGRKKG